MILRQGATAEMRRPCPVRQGRHIGKEVAVSDAPAIAPFPRRARGYILPGTVMFTEEMGPAR